MTDEEVEAAVKQEADDVKTISFQHARENSVVYEALPEGLDAKQLDTKHPNDAVETMINFLANRCVSALGLSKVFATGNPSDTDWRANQLYSAGAIVEFQKDLEQICDFVFMNFVKWATKKELFSLTDLGENFMSHVSWEWKGIDDLDENSHQDAIAKMLANNTATYKEILGNNWKEQLLQTKEEIEWFKENNLAHPSYAMKSGGERTGADEI